MPTIQLYAKSVDDLDMCYPLYAPEARECPLCHTALRPEIKEAFLVSLSEQYFVYVVAFCPLCREVFFIKYGNPGAVRAGATTQYIRMIPTKNHPQSFPEGVSVLSPDFVRIYNQAKDAEDHGLTDLCGMGYRKALEFLVKDYLIHLHPEDGDAIKKELLNNSINRIESGKIKTLAQKSAWIGNDETHYERRHEALDYTDLKRFISAAVSYIDSELIFEEALSIEAKK